MNGPDHYKAAEICLAHATDLLRDGDDEDMDTVRLMLATSKAHTAQAQVAAIAFGITAGPNAPETKTAEAWRDAIA